MNVIGRHLHRRTCLAWLAAAGISIGAAQGCDAAKGCQAQLGLIGSGGGGADGKADKPLQMRTVTDLLELVDAFGSPGFGLDQAVARLGPVKEWAGAMGEIDPASPALRETFVEMNEGELRAIDSHFEEPIHATWDEVVDSLGAPLDEDWEHRHGPAIFEFERSSATGPVEVDLGVHRDGDAARIESFMIRRPSR